MIGAPGSGKGTQGALLAEFLGLPCIGLGDLMRAEVQAGTPRGRELQEHMDAGRLAPDDLASEIVEVALTSSTDGFVLDGYPRTVAQAVRLDDFLATRAADLDLVVVFRVAEDALISRLASRGREDDQPEVIRQRLAIYWESANELIAYYGGRIVELAADGAVDDVHARLLEGLREAIAS